MEHLLFRLHGPLGSWGEEAVGEMRPTASHPSKSAVLGLVAAALGMRYDEDEPHARLARETGFAVRIDRAGSLVPDFHTAEAPRGKRAGHWLTRRDELAAVGTKANPVISRRDYLCDALFTVCLWSRTHEPAYHLADVAAALDHPVFVLYLGRKSCALALPLQPQLLEAETLAEAFARTTFADGADVAAIGRNPPHGTDGLDLHFDTHPAPGLHIVHEVPRRDETSSLRRRQHLLRSESYGRLQVSTQGD